MMTDNDINNIISKNQSDVYILYRKRFYVLAVFSFLAFNQCAFWLTFSPVSPSTQTYYNISSTTVDLLLNWGPIIFIPCLPLSYLLINTHNGIRRTVILLAIACFVATLLRVIPLIFVSPSNPRFKTVSLPFLHIGQIINAACGPLVMAPVSQLSCLWFGPNERTRATTVAIMSNIFGATVSFLVNPAIVSDPTKISNLLYFHLALAFVAGLFAIIHFPSQPPTPPSPAGKLLMTGEGEMQNSGLRTYWEHLRTFIYNPSSVLLAIAGGVMSGTFGMWSSMFAMILQPEHYSEQQAGWFGFASTLAGIIGGFCLGSLADTSRFRRSLKTFILLAFTACLIVVVWFQLSVPSIFYDKSILTSTTVTIGLSLTLAGFFQGASSPLIVESLAETTFPLPESLSASILVEWNNITFVILLFAGSGRYQLINLLVIISILLSIIMVLFVRVTYKRRDEDERKRIETNETGDLNNVNLDLNAMQY